MKRNKTEIEPEKRMSEAQCNCSAPAEQCPSSDLPPWTMPPSSCTEWDAPWWGTSLWAVQVSRPGHGPCQLLVQLLVQHEGVTSVILTLNPTHDTAPAVRKTLNSIPAKTRTISTPYSITSTSCPGPTLPRTTQAISTTFLHTYMQEPFPQSRGHPYETPAESIWSMTLGSICQNGLSG